MKAKRVRRKTPPFPLKAMLANAGVSQLQLARSTKLTPQSINAIANGRQEPSWRTVLLICTSLGVDVSKLAEGVSCDAAGNGRRAS